MLSFKKYVNLVEELTDQQKEQVKDWIRDEKHHSHTDHFFGIDANGERRDSILEPLQGHEEKSEPHRAIERHLGKEISVDKYRAGLVTDKYGRDIKIGSLLKKTNAPESLLNQFSNDSTRQLKKTNNLFVHVSRAPEDVAGQTSRGQSWENESCKNFETGSHKDSLYGEVKNGTVVAYLKDHTGKELARQTFQPYRHQLSDKTIYLRNGYYGPKVAAFEKHCEGLEKRLSASHQPFDADYQIDPEVYNDSDRVYGIHPSTSTEKMKQYLLTPGEERKSISALRSPDHTAEHVALGMKHEFPYVRANAVRSKHARYEDIVNALSDKIAHVRSAALDSPALSADHITMILSKDGNGAHIEPSDAIRRIALYHKKMNSGHLHLALDDNNEAVRRAALRNSNIEQEHIQKALKDTSKAIRVQALLHPKTTYEQKKYVYENDPHESVRYYAKSVMDPNHWMNWKTDLTVE